MVQQTYRFYTSSYPLARKRVGTVVLILNHVPAPCCHDDPSLDRKDKPGNDGGKTPKRDLDR
jgi:hypothetical protein